MDNTQAVAVQNCPFTTAMVYHIKNYS